MSNFEATHVSIGGVEAEIVIDSSGQRAHVLLADSESHFSCNADKIHLLFVPIKPPKMVTIPLAVAKDLLQLNAVMGHNFRVLDAAIVAAEREEASNG